MSRKNKPQSKSSKKLAQLPTKSLAAESKGPSARQIFTDASAKKGVGQATADGFFNFLSRLGLNNNNALSDSTYVFNMVTRNRILLEAAYRGSWVVGAIVDVVAEDMTREGIDINTADEVDLSQLEKELTYKQVWQSFASGIKWGRLYGGAIGVIQIAGQDLSTPLDHKTIAKGQFEGITVFDRWMVNPDLTRCIQSGPDMGLPEYYQIVTSYQNAESAQLKPTGIVVVHHSRVIRFIGIELPFFQAITEMMWGESNLERLWDRLISFDNATMSSGQLIDRANLRTVGVDGLREIIAAGGEAVAGLEAMFEMMRLVQTNEGLTLIDKEDTFQSTAYTFAGLSDMLLQFGQQLSGATGIPLIRLFGQLPAGLGGGNGETDIRMYYDNINAQQEARLRRPWDKLLKVLWPSVYGIAAPEDLEFEFTPLWQMSQKDKAENAKATTETVIEAFNSGLVPAHTAMQELKDASSDTGLFSNISDKDIKEAELEPPPTPGQMALEAQANAAEENPEEGKPGEEKKDEKPKATSDWSMWGNGPKGRFWRRLFGGADEAGFKESEHPRNESGEFSAGGGGGSSGSTTLPKKKKKSLEEVFKQAIKKGPKGFEVHRPEYHGTQQVGTHIVETFGTEAEAQAYVSTLVKLK